MAAFHININFALLTYLHDFPSMRNSLKKVTFSTKFVFRSRNIASRNGMKKN